MQTVEKWMTKNPYTIEDDATIMEAIHLMKEKEVRRLPVVKKKKLVGLITDRMIKEYTPSKATALDTFELNYILSTTKVKDVMNSKPFTVTPDTELTKAAQLLLDKKLYGLCVLDDSGKIVGILTSGDFLKALISAYREK